MPTPEQSAREKIDELLTAAGWLVKDMGQLNQSKGLGVVVCEFYTA